MPSSSCQTLGVAALQLPSWKWRSAGTVLQQVVHPGQAHSVHLAARLSLPCNVRDSACARPRCSCPRGAMPDLSAHPRPAAAAAERRGWRVQANAPAALFTQSIALSSAASAATGGK